MLADLAAILGNVAALEAGRSRGAYDLHSTEDVAPEAPTGQEGLLGTWESEREPGDPNRLHLHEDRKEWVLRTNSSAAWGADEFKRCTPKALATAPPPERPAAGYECINPSRARVLEGGEARRRLVERSQAKKRAERRKERSAPLGDTKRLLASYLAGLDAGTRGDVARAALAARREAQAKEMEAALGM